MAIQEKHIDDKLFAWLEAHHRGIRKAHERFVNPYKESEFPTKKHEDWKYTDIAHVFEQEYEPVPKAEISGNELLALVPLKDFAGRIVFINGEYSHALSSYDHTGIIVESLDDYSRRDACGYNALLDGTKVSQSGKFQYLNSIFAHHGAVVRVARNVQVTKPICVVYINTGDTISVLNTRNIIVSEGFSKCTFESFHIAKGANKFFSNSVSEIFVREGASVTYNQLYRESTQNTTVHSVEVLQEANSTFAANSFLLDGGTIRNNIRVAHIGEGCTTQLNGLYIPTGNQQFDSFTLVDHKQPNCTTSEMYKGVAAGEATGTFVGKIYVAPGAQKTSANQSNRNILLSPEATIHSKPQLEIWADDVSCTHGSTVGQLNPDHLFYCQARGISRDEAVRLLLHAFIEEVVEKVTNEEIKVMIEESIAEKLSV